jgi:hypothetical protein
VNIPTDYYVTTRRVQSQPDYGQILVASTDQSIVFEQIVDQGFLYDGMFLERKLNDTYVDHLGPLSSTFLSIFSFAFCNLYPPNTKAKLLTYDPSLSMLFNPGPSPNGQPSESPKLKSQNKGALIAAIVVPIVVVCLIGALIISYFASTKVQHFFQPFKKRTVAK